jgi:septal ring-binding cell division protein DamX
MTQRFIINLTRLLTLSGFIFLAACSTTPDKETTVREETSQDIIFNKAKEAYLSRNYKVASALFSNLAEKGHADSQYSLGYMYYYGNGVSKNLKQATHWFNLSAAQGNSNAATALATIQKMIADSKQAQNPTTGSQAQTVTQPQNNSQSTVIDLRQSRQANTSNPNALRPEPVIARPEPVIARPEPVIAQPESNTSIQTNQTATLNSPPIKRSAREIQNSQWILKQPSSYYTIQLASSSSRTKTMKFIRRVELDGVYFFRTRVNDVDRYTVIHGSFPKYGMAQAKLSLLKKRGYKNVWIRGMRGIKTAIKRQ